MDEFVNMGQLQIMDPESHPANRGYNQKWSNGLTKREYFAAMAMQGFCSNHEFQRLSSEVSTKMDIPPEKVAANLVEVSAFSAVAYADALILALSKKDEK